jgi:hypothetical protein
VSGYVPEQPVDERTAESLASTQIRWHEMRVLCGACGGVGCEHCKEPDPPSRWQRFLDWLTREAGA